MTPFSCRQALLALPLLLLISADRCAPQVLGIRGDGKLPPARPERPIWESGLGPPAGRRLCSAGRARRSPPTPRRRALRGS